MRKWAISTLCVAYSSLVVLLIANDVTGDNAARIEAVAVIVFPLSMLATLIVVIATCYMARIHKSRACPPAVCMLTLFLFPLFYALPGLLESRVWRTNADTLRAMRVLDFAIHGHVERSGRLPDRLTDTGVRDSFSDPYSPDHGALRWIVLSPSRGLIISVGPDRQMDMSDQGVGILYDSSNGTVSRGDMVGAVDVTAPPGAPGAPGAGPK